MTAPRKRAPRKPEERPKSFVEIVAAGDRRASLTALRDELARHISAGEKDVPSLARQLTVVLRELDELPNPAEESKVDDLSTRRANRIAAASS
jgi:hypothetical protein